MTEIFCVQDRTGTAAQLTIDADTTDPVEVGDTGVYSGRDYQGIVQSYDFTVGAVNDPRNFCITTMTPEGGPGDVLRSRWARHGTITWLTGSNVLETTTVDKRYSANAYVDVATFLDYHASRGNLVVESPLDPIRKAIVLGTDYLDQKFRYKGSKMLQYLSSGALDPVYLDPWFALTGVGFPGFPGVRSSFAPSATSQTTQWPRQGVIDYNGDQVWGIPDVVKFAVCEAAIRVMNGIVLQPDYDTDFVGNGGIVTSITEDVGPIKESRTFDTKMGMGFFPDIPQVRRMLSKAGVLLAGGGRSITR